MSTTSTFTFLKSQLASSLAPLQVHPGRGEPQLPLNQFTSCRTIPLSADTPFPPYWWIFYCMDARWAQPCLVHTARKVFEVPEALEFNPVREVNLKTLSHWTILRGVHFMLWCFISGGSHGWLFEQEKFLSHRPFSFSPYSLSPHCPKRSTYRCQVYLM